MARISILNKFYNAGPLILLYYLCISEVDTNLEKIFEIFTLNFHHYKKHIYIKLNQKIIQVFLKEEKFFFIIIVLTSKN